MVIKGLILFLLVGTSFIKENEKHQRIDLELPPACVQKITLVDCDLTGDTPQCKTIKVNYRPASCAIVHIVEAK